jgi:hypothetical protein
VRRMLARSPNLVMVSLASILLACAFAPVSAVVSYQPGVKAGDSATYGQVNASWKSSVAPFSPVEDFVGVSSITISVLNVVGTNVTARQTYNYPNGTSRSLVGVENLQSGAENVSTPIAWIIAGSLTAPDTLYNSSSADSIARTVQGVYAGSARTVNIINSTQPEPGGFCKFLRIWDQHSGFLIGFAMNYTVSNANYQVSASASAWMSGTSVWGTVLTTPAVVSSPMFVLAAVSGVIGSAMAFAVHTKRSRIKNL